MRRPPNRPQKSVKPSAPSPRPVAEIFAGLLFAEVPPPVVQRLQTMNAVLADNMRGLDDVGRNNMREALARWSCRLPEGLESWNHAFVAAMAHVHEAKFAKLLRQLPDPPPEPPGLWETLATQATVPDETGLAACLILYDLGCARAFLAFKRSA
ncbi:hypothetical protein SAMN02949497_0949 [Methylomagnum ishizawai]|uniref:Uncharacterized protein n=1 Tax=Methylomagnum ishizawai TaxID=1760988 RepID=A0A1Y6CZC8_9GAMM|nr:hypothetical protein SAMN02949497_0949 [Methylomagnum ishizawai]